MQEPGWTSRTLQNLAAIETALDALDAEMAGDSPVADGIGAQAEATGETGDIGAGERACAGHGPSVAGTAPMPGASLRPPQHCRLEVMGKKLTKPRLFHLLRPSKRDFL